MDKNQYNVMLLGVPEHESLIFKLIFSVSLKSRVSSNAYTLTSTDQPEMADILICNDCNMDIPDTQSNTIAARITLVNTRPSDAGDYLQRPLIATRVLSSLDQLMSRLNQVESNATPLPHNEATASIAVPNVIQETSVKHHNPAVDEVDEIDEMDFLISEDEASELAIVHDESLMNPANVSDIGTVHDHAVELEAQQAVVPINDNNAMKDTSDDTIVTSHSAETDLPSRETHKTAHTTDPSGASITAIKNPESSQLSDDMSRVERTPTPSNAGINAAHAPGDASASVATTSGNLASHRVADVIPNEIASSQSVSVGKALVVDDSASVRKQLELELALFNVDVDYAENADEAYQLLSNQIYDVAFLDVVLPDSDGFLICKSIKNNNKQTNVVMLTSKASPADKVKGSLAGCDDYLVKPVGRQTFQDATRKYLKFTASTKVMEA